MAAFITYLKRQKRYALLLTVVVFGLLYLYTRTEGAAFLAYREFRRSGNMRFYVKPEEDTLLADGTDGITITGSSIALSSVLALNVTTSSRTDAGKKKPLVLIVVLSEMGKTEERQAIRNTWYKWADGVTAKIVFFLGVHTKLVTTEEVEGLTVEMNEFNDIVIDQMEEHYFLLAVKVLRMFKWFLRKYPDDTVRPDFLLKTDHDVFNHVPSLLKTLNSVQGSRDFVGGDLDILPPVVRDTFSKWYTPVDIWPIDVYPNYIGGPFYVLSGSVVESVFESSLDAPLFHLEDVFVIGFVANTKLGLELTHINYVMRNFKAEVEYNSTFLQNIVAVHPLTPRKMIDFYQKYQQANLI